MLSIFALILFSSLKSRALLDNEIHLCPLLQIQHKYFDPMQESTVQLVTVLIKAELEKIFPGTLKILEKSPDLLFRYVQVTSSAKVL